MSKPDLVKNVFDWDHFLLYLSGSIDFDREGGVAWRDEWTEKLVAVGFKSHQIINPCRKPLGAAPFNLDNESEIMGKYRSNREWSELCKVMSHIAHVDCRFVDKSDLILVNMPKVGQKHFQSLTEEFEKNFDEVLVTIDHMPTLHKMDRMKEIYFKLLAQTADQRVPTYGTIHEMVVAHQQRKPVFMVWEGGKETCSAWLMWMIGHNHVFGTFDELLTRLINISKGRAAYNAKEWLLLDLSGEEEKEVDLEGANEYNTSDKGV